MPSTLQFKFNINLDDVVESRGRFFPSEYADITSEKGEWKLMPEPTPDPESRDGKLASAVHKIKMETYGVLIFELIISLLQALKSMR